MDEAKDVAALKGKYIGQIVRNGEVIDEFEFDNLCTTEGLNYVLNASFGVSSANASWYTGLFEGNYTPTAGAVAATVAAAATECVAYAGATRPAWTVVASTAASLTNGAARADFVFSSAKTLYGAFLISNNTKAGTTGTLFSIARFTTSKAVDIGDELLLTYLLTATGA